MPKIRVGTFTSAAGTTAEIPVEVYFIENNVTSLTEYEITITYTSDTLNLHPDYSNTKQRIESTAAVNFIPTDTSIFALDNSTSYFNETGSDGTIKLTGAVTESYRPLGAPIKPSEITSDKPYILGKLFIKIPSTSTAGSTTALTTTLRTAKLYIGWSENSVLTTTEVTSGSIKVTPGTTYTLTPSAATINEGAVLTSTISTTNVATGTKFYYALSGTGITTTDFSAGALTGEGTTDATGKFTFTHTLANDLITEGSETLNIKLFSDSSRTIQVGNIASVSIDDTSGTPTPVINKTTSIHRFFNSKSGVHLYSPSNEEKDTIINNPAWGYKYEGVAYQAPLTGGTELYRFYNADKNYHFNTASTGEALSIIQNALGANYDLITGINQNPISGSWGFKYEGRSFRVSETKTEHNSTPVYRFFHAQKSVHFYSSSLIEVNNVIGMSNGEQYKDNFLAAAGAPLLNGGWGYKFEGVAWFI